MLTRICFLKAMIMIWIVITVVMPRHISLACYLTSQFIKTWSLERQPLIINSHTILVIVVRRTGHPLFNPV